MLLDTQHSRVMSNQASVTAHNIQRNCHNMSRTIPIVIQ